AYSTSLREGQLLRSAMNGATLAIAPCHHLSASFQTFVHAPKTSRIIVGVLPAGNAPESFDSGGGPALPSRDRRSHGAGEAASKGSPAATTGGACWTST